MDYYADITGWDPAQPMMGGAILHLRGMTLLPGSQADTYTLSMSITPRLMILSALRRISDFGILTKDASGEWVKAVSKNFGGTENFVLGPWKANYGLGTYGLDLRKGTAWAVINYNSDFTVGRSDK